jgi:Proteins of 100 residues with WXG
VTQFAVTPQYIATAATNCHNTAAGIQDELTALRSYVDLGAVYLGVTSDKFQALMIDFQRYAIMLHNSLDDIGSGLQGNFVNYVQMEEANMALLVPIDGEIPSANLSPVPTGSPAGPGQISNP